MLRNGSRGSVDLLLLSQEVLFRDSMSLLSGVNVLFHSVHVVLLLRRKSLVNYDAVFTGSRQKFDIVFVDLFFDFKALLVDLSLFLAVFLAMLVNRHNLVHMIIKSFVHLLEVWRRVVVSKKIHFFIY